MLWSKSILKRLLRLAVIFMVIVINKGDVMNLEQLTNVVKQLEETIKADQVEKSQLKSHITHLETELESVKNKSLRTICLQPWPKIRAIQDTFSDFGQKKRAIQERLANSGQNCVQLYPEGMGVKNS